MVSGYVGLIAVTDIAKVPMSGWPSLNAREVARTDILPAGPAETVANVAARMRSSRADASAVTDANVVIGVVTLRDLANVEVLLDRLENEST